MTQQEQDAILGQTKREYIEARNKLGALKKRNEGIATSAESLMNAVRKQPERILVPQGQQAAAGTVAHALAMSNIEFVYSEEHSGRLQPDFLRLHLAEYVSVLESVARLRRELIEQGDDDPEQ